jgi:hypothetical protein
MIEVSQTPSPITVAAMSADSLPLLDDGNWL